MYIRAPISFVRQTSYIDVVSKIIQQRILVHEKKKRIMKKAMNKALYMH